MESTPHQAFVEYFLSFCYAFDLRPHQAKDKTEEIKVLYFDIDHEKSHGHNR